MRMVWFRLHMLDNWMQHVAELWYLFLCSMHWFKGRLKLWLLLPTSHTICVRAFCSFGTIKLIPSCRPYHPWRSANSRGLHRQLYLQEVHLKSSHFVNLLKGNCFRRINEFAPTPEKPFVLGLPTGSSPIPTYKALVALVKTHKLSWVEYPLLQFHVSSIC